MKYLFALIFLTFTFSLHAQDMKAIEKELNTVFAKINYYDSVSRAAHEIDAYDSIEMANKKFEKLLIQYTNKFPQTIKYDFNSLKNNFLQITTSADGLFRIYSWDSYEGGTMHIFRNVFQYISNGKTKAISSLNSSEENGYDPGCSYDSLMDIVSQRKKYYITQNVAILSSAEQMFTIKVFSIDNGKLNDKSKLIKTTTGIKNELSVYVNWNSAANKNSHRPETGVGFDPQNKTISIPLILADGTITDKLIVYKLTGKYFERQGQK